MFYIIHAMILHRQERHTGWPRKNLPNFRMALCNRAGEVNQQKTMYVMSKHKISPKTLPY